MLTFMLCGASDTEDVRDAFLEVCNGFGAEGLHFVSGQLRHINALTRTWEDNSRDSVIESKLCVFVILRRYGEVTWMVEFTEAIRTGTPLLVLCLDETWSKYRTVRYDGASLETTDLDARLYDQLARVVDEQVNVVQFGSDGFAHILRPQIAALVAGSLLHQQERARRKALATLLADPESLSPTEVDITTRIAEDEAEDKFLRKHAVAALADRRSGVSIATLHALLNSWEQGVQRLTALRLHDLYPERPPSPQFLDMCVAVAAEADDVGLPRRLATTLLEIDLAAGISTVSRFDLDDVGLRRRISASLLRMKEQALALGLHSQAAALATRCLGDGSSEVGWKDQLRNFVRDLTPRESES